MTTVKALVTGSAGFVGRHMATELHRRGFDVDAVDLADGNDAHAVFRSGTIRYDLVVHAAAKAPYRAAIDGQPDTFPYNIGLDSAMFAWAIRTRQRRILYLSSCAVLDGPDDYGWTKLTGERMAASARACDIPVSVVRPFSGYGADQGTNWPFGAFLDRARRRMDPFPIWGDGNQVRDWTHIDDIVQGALAVVDHGTDQPVSLCTGVGTSMTDLARLVCIQAGYRPEFAYQADQPAGVGYRVGDPALFHSIYRPTVTVEEGVKRALD